MTRPGHACSKDKPVRAVRISIRPGARRAARRRRGDEKSDSLMSVIGAPKAARALVTRGALSAWRRPRDPGRPSRADGRGGRARTRRRSGIGRHARRTCATDRQSPGSSGNSPRHRQSRRSAATPGGHVGRRNGMPSIRGRAGPDSAADANRRTVIREARDAVGLVSMVVFYRNQSLA